MAAKVHSSKPVEEHSPLNVEEAIISLFEADTLASAQYFQNCRRKATLEPEKRLMLSMLEDAVRCFQIYLTARSGREKRLFNEAEEWIMTKQDDWIFSFPNVCEMLGFSPEYVRQGLRRWKQKTPGKAYDSRISAAEKVGWVTPAAGSTSWPQQPATSRVI
jgi:hypothetical protein